MTKTKTQGTGEQEYSASRNNQAMDKLCLVASTGVIGQVDT